MAKLNPIALLRYFMNQTAIRFIDEGNAAPIKSSDSNVSFVYMFLIVHESSFRGNPVTR